MAYAVAFFLLASTWSLQVNAKCNEDVLNKIKALNLDNTNLMQNMIGEFKIVSLEAGRMTQSHRSHKVCATLSFLKEGETYKVDYKKINAGVHDLVQEGGGVFKHKGGENEPDMTYYPIQNTHGELAFYVCFDEEVEGPALWFVLVPLDATDYSKKVEAAKQTIKSVGLPDGIDFPACEKVNTVSAAEATYSEGLKHENKLTAII